MSDYLTSEALISDFMEGKHRAYHALHKHFYPEIYTFCVRLIDNKEDAKDIAQDTFAKLFLKQKDFDNLIDIKAFLYIVSRHGCMDYFRYIKKVKKANRVILQTLAGPSQMIFNDQLDGLYLTSVRSYLDKLPARQKQAIHLLFFEEKRLTEAAQEMNISVNGVKFLRARAIAKLKEIFSSTPYYHITAFLTLLVYYRRL